MSKKLCVEVMNLKGAVMNVDGRLLLAKEGVMINIILAAIEMEKTGDILAIGREQDIGWLECEVVAIEFECFVEVGDILTEMAELVH
jgi:hypothetical protein